MFTITGTYATVPARVEWRDGEVLADGAGDSALEMAAVLVQRGLLVREGPWRGIADLKDEFMARITLLSVFDEGAVIDGDELPEDEPPDDSGEWIG